MQKQKPERIQRRRTKGYKLPPNTRSCTRPGPYGNPYKIGEKFDPKLRVMKWYGDGTITLANSLQAFRSYAEDRLLREPTWLDPLRGWNLACFCSLDSDCHVDILLELANA